MQSISYNEPGQASYKSITVATTGTDILTISDLSQLKKSQFSIMSTADLTSATNVKLSFLYSPDNGTTWVGVPIISNTTGVAADIPTIINTTSYSLGSNIYGSIIDIPVSGATSFKIKGTATTAESAVKVWVFARDN
jgi:hypothetical protein